VQEIDAKERILQAALVIFGDNGFKSTTIREICKKADVSLALVNYHFRNKQSLYEELVTCALDRAFNSIPISNFIKDDMPPEEKLRNFIRMLLYLLLGKEGIGVNQASFRLISRELTNPTEVMDTLFNKHFSKMIALMASILNELMPGLDKTQILRFTSSIAGQCLHPVLAREILSRSGFVLSNCNEDIEKHAEHIYKFSLNGIQGYRGDSK